MVKEAIILAGGLGTRLQSVVAEQPKSLAQVDGVPFLAYLIRFLTASGIERFVFSLGHKHEMIEDFLRKNFSHLQYSTVVETEPLGTGGGILLAMQQCRSGSAFIFNGDTMFKVDMAFMNQFHEHTGAVCSIALKPMLDFDRYGAVELAHDSRIVAFREKRHTASGLINGGVYLLNRDAFLRESLPSKFSFEKDYLQPQVAARGAVFGCVQDVFFIDIGVPDDYRRAQSEPELLGLLNKS